MNNHRSLPAPRRRAHARLALLCRMQVWLMPSAATLHLGAALTECIHALAHMRMKLLDEAMSFRAC